MSEIRKHLEENYKEAENNYETVYCKLNDKKKELVNLQREVDWMFKNLEKYEADRDYYQKLLNELNNENHE
jgi:hypothetical protein